MKVYKGRYVTEELPSMKNDYQFYYGRDFGSGMLLLHRLVGRAFIPKPIPKPKERMNFIKAKDGNYLNCNVENLCWSHNHK